METLNFALVLLTTLLQNNQERILKLTEPKIAYAEVIPAIEEWKYKLRQCESSGNDEALNPVDINNKRSVGRYQFQDTTFEWLSKKYKIPTTNIWNGEEQEMLLDRMIVDKDLDLQTQFPDCIKKIGLPPEGD